MLRDELGVPPSVVFAYISPAPVAAASLGQVRCGCAPSSAAAADEAEAASSPTLLRAACVLTRARGLHPRPAGPQVYRARLKASGEEVAVKVQRPGVVEAIALDTYILRYVAGALPEGSARTRRAGLAT